MNATDIIHLFEQIEMPNPEDIVISKIRELIADGKIKGGDRLPSERRLEERLKLPRGVISRAFRRLESYGILKTIPQSGTYITELSAQALDGLIANALKPDEGQLEPLTAVRSVLEAYAVELIAANGSDAAIASIEEAVEVFRNRVKADTVHYDEDMVFHLKLASGAGNPVLNSVLTRLIVTSMELLNSVEGSIGHSRLISRLAEAADEHERIAAALKKRDAAEAKKAIMDHFSSAGRFLRQLPE